MTGIDSSEIILLLIIGLIVLGPKRLPEIANRVGAWIGQARRMTRMMKRQLEEELNLDGKPARSPSIAPPVFPGSRKPAEPVEADPHIPNDDDTFSPAHGAEEPREPDEKSGSSA